MLSFVIQSLFLALLALLIGPFLALQGVKLIAHSFLPAVDQNALNILTRDPLQTVVSESWFASGAALCATIVMIITVYRSYGSNILLVRREASRTQRSPLWQRLYLDVVLSLLVAVGYIRAALTQSSLQLVSLLDRRAELQASYEDALFIAITGTLRVNTLAALFLGIITTMCVMWTSVVRRQIDFSVKVVLGMTRQQLIYLLLWEFSLIYIIALVLGVGLGIALSQVVTPLLVFTNSTNSGDFFSQIAIPPVQIIIPVQPIVLFLSGSILFLVILLCLFTMTVSRRAISQVLRLNED